MKTEERHSKQKEELVTSAGSVRMEKLWVRRDWNEKREGEAGVDDGGPIVPYLGDFSFSSRSNRTG